MSIDGPGILASDLAHDVYNEILDLYDSGVPISNIRSRIATYEESFANDLDREIYLAASAKAYWEIGHLTETLRSELSRLVKSETSLALWAESADKHLANARKTALLRLLRKIAEPNRKPRPRKKYPKIRTKLYSVGDCLQLAIAGKVYRGVVCKILEYRGQCEYAVLVMEPDTRSSTESFKSGKYYGRRIPSTLDKRGYIYGPHVIRLEHRMLVRAGNPFKIVGHIELDETTYILGSFGGVIEMSHVIEDFERTETKSELFGDELLFLRQLIRNG